MDRELCKQVSIALLCLVLHFKGCVAVCSLPDSQHAHNANLEVI